MLSFGLLLVWCQSHWYDWGIGPANVHLPAPRSSSGPGFTVAGRRIMVHQECIVPQLFISNDLKRLPLHLANNRVIPRYVILSLYSLPSRDQKEG